MNPGLVWIDARHTASGWWLWGMNLIERQVRQAALQGFSRLRIWVSPFSQKEAQRLRPDLARAYPVHLEFAIAQDAGPLCADLEQVDEEVLLLEGNLVWDERILAHLLQCGPDAAVVEAGKVVAYLSAAKARSLGAAWAREPGLGRLGVVLRTRARELGVDLHRPGELSPYVPSLRLRMVPHLLRVSNSAQLKTADHLLYRRTFKGVIDVVALYGYYHLVRWITRQLSHTRLPPNLFTALSILSIWAVIPCFALGQLGLGVALAWVGVILDSVDGKLARLTLRLSEAMGRIEHVVAAPALGLWYVVLGWHCSEGALFAPGPMALSTWVLVGAFLLDKIVSGTFKARFRRELFDYRPLDAAFHLIASRRNISLLLLTIGVLLGQEHLTLVLMAGWMGATLLFHTSRWLWVEVRAPRRKRRRSRA